MLSMFEIKDVYKKGKKGRKNKNIMQCTYQLLIIYK